VSRLRGCAVAVVMATLASGVFAQTTSEAVAAQLRAHLDEQDDLPSKTGSLQCAEPPAVVGTPFQCHGLLAGGNLIVLRVKLDAESNIEILESVYYPAADGTMRSFLGPMVIPPIADLRCDPEPAPLQRFQCKGTLADRSRIVVDGERQADGRLIIGPIAYHADPPSPLVRAVQEELGDDVTTVTCNPFERATQQVCQATRKNGGVADVKVLRRADDAFVAGDGMLWKVLRGAARAGLVLGPILIIGTGIWLATLSLRSVVARVPVIGPQEVSLEGPRDYALSIEGPRFSNAWGLNYSIHESGAGREVPLTPILIPVTVSGFTRVRRSVRRFSVERSGRYVVQTYVPPGRNAGKLAVVITRSFFGKAFLAIVGMVAGVFATGIGLIATL
jgi:hypothetical protein